MKTIAFALQKGGVGKTSISVVVAQEIAKTKKVLLIDADPQGNASSWVLGDTEGTINNELVDYLLQRKSIGEVIMNTSVKNLFIIPTASLDSNLRSYQAKDASQNPYRFLDLIEEAEKNFDFCIIDTSPNFDDLNSSVFIASDEIINVIKLDEFSKDGLEIFNENLNSLKKRYRIPEDKAIRNKIIVNCYEKRKKDQNLYLGFLKQIEELGYKFYIIPSTVAFPRAQRKKVSFDGLKVRSDVLDEIKVISNDLSK